ncbi:MAG: PfkB family carbohydrate kinase [Chloroflexota bacterium]|nr:PfkB family carbohydrate kinase [Chloroflexota bacterium]
MIVVVGNPLARAPELGGGVAGTPARTAVAAARAGASVQLVGKAGDDPAGDAVLLALAAAGVGHVALLRDPARGTPMAVGPEDADAVEGPFSNDEPEAWPQVIPEDPAARPSLEPADVELALRYLSDYRAIVIAEPQPDAIVAIAAEAAAYTGAQLVLVVAADSIAPVPTAALVLESPAHDPDGAFAALLGEFAAAIDAGASGADAFRSLGQRVGLAPSMD